MSTHQLAVVLLAALAACRASESATATGATDAAEPRPRGFDPAMFAVEAPRLPPAEAAAILEHEQIRDHEPALHIGAAAPALHVEGWLKGDAVTVEAGTVYVVENWATWCKPCIEAMPHLTDLAERYAGSGVVVVAVNVEDADLDKIRAFVGEHTAQMRYAVGYDRSGATDETWIGAAGLRGLPASFVVDRAGRLAWVGHPKGLDAVVAKIADQTWDLQAARQSATRARLAVPYSKRVVELLASDPTRGYRLARVLLGTVLADQPDYLDGLAYHILAAPAVVERDLELAYTAGAIASAQRGWSDPASLETLSKIREAQGRRQAAIALQQRAGAVSHGEDRYAARLQQLTHN